MSKGYNFCFCVLLLCATAPLIAQSSHNVFFEIETVGMTGSGNHSPYWHTSNRQGLPSTKNSNGYAHYALMGETFMSSGLGLSYGMDIGLAAGQESLFFLHQLYLDFDYRWLGVSVGMKERWNDKSRNLSSGALTWSGNSQPIPEVRLGIPDYVRIPFWGDWFSLKCNIGYGRLTDDKWRKDHGSGTYTDGIIYHSKSLFLRFGDEQRSPFQLTLGLEMNNMFGGIRHSDGTERELPSDIDAYLTAMFPFHKIEQQGTDDGDNLGSWHLNFDYFVKGWQLRTYYEHFFEDHSAMLGIEYKNNIEGKKGFIFYGFRRNWLDGLFGVEVNAPESVSYFKNIVFEFLNTKGQSGPICHSAAHNSEGMFVIEEVDGRENMYNHSINDSYTHYGYAIGNPILISPVYYGGERFRSCRLQMFHVGVEGGITPYIDYRILSSTTQHWGRYGAPLKEVERITSVMVECTYKISGLHGWKVGLSGAADFDSGSDGVYMLGNNKGVLFSIKRDWKVK